MYWASEDEVKGGVPCLINLGFPWSYSERIFVRRGPVPCSVFLHQCKLEFHLRMLWWYKNDAAVVHSEVVNTILILRIVQKENIRKK